MGDTSACTMSVSDRIGEHFGLPSTSGSQVSTQPSVKLDKPYRELTDVTVKVYYAHGPPVMMSRSKSRQRCGMIAT